ncbi:MAG: efflux RND transporter periplasmic adaptor subunit, partial [Planctomycetaceae bacterium]|nr:efflux RND transporter periplasmic adaptor subunit [Planctomycetaceae bacterium]
MKFTNKLSSNYPNPITTTTKKLTHNLTTNSIIITLLKNKLRLIVICLICSFLICGVSGCSFFAKKDAEKTEEKKDKKPDAPEVIFDTVVEEDVQLYLNVEGWTTPYKSVDIRVRVAGFLKKYFYSHGDIVKKDSPLAQIEQE